MATCASVSGGGPCHRLFDRPGCSKEGIQSGIKWTHSDRREQEEQEEEEEERKKERKEEEEEKKPWLFPILM
jgi:hypothetical protein